MPEGMPNMMTLAGPQSTAKVHPLGPIAYRNRSGNRRATRLWGIFILCGLSAVLATAAMLPPDARGFGTHQALGLPDCGMVWLTGYPCPTCGMTTAFSHTVRGQWWAAIQAQPAGWLACMALFAGCVLCLDAIVVGRHWRFNWYRVSATWVAVSLIGLLLGGWAFKIIAGVMSGTLPVSE